MATASEPGEHGSPSVVLRAKSGRRISRHLSFRDSVASVRIDRSEIGEYLRGGPHHTHNTITRVHLIPLVIDIRVYKRCLS